MDITPQLEDVYKNKVKTIIDETKMDHENNDEEIIKILQSSFISNNYSGSDVSTLDTVSINTSPCSERYYSLSSHNSSDKLCGHVRGCSSNNRSMDNASDISSDYGCDEDTKICSKLAKYFLSKCFCIDDD